MPFKSQLINWLKRDQFRIDALMVASTLQLNDWCLAAGFVRNLVWDKRHGFDVVNPLNDLDLIYFDPDNLDEQKDKDLEIQLKTLRNYPWSVKNQARMHIRNGHNPYKSTQDAMSYWPEVETAVGVRFDNNSDLELVVPFGLGALFTNTITLNSKFSNSDEFYNRIEGKGWLTKWPNLVVVR